MKILLPNYHGRDRISLVLNKEDIEHSNLKNTVVLDGKNIIIDEVNYDLGSSKDRFYDEIQEGDIISINQAGVVYKLFASGDNDATIFITGQCNSNCIMCPCSDWERKYNNGYSDRLIQDYIELLPSDLPYLVVTGGEPTLKTNQFFEVLKQISEKYINAEVLLLSNGRSFASQHMVERLLEHCPKFLQIGIPIHGHNAVLHDSISRADGSFKQTCIGIRNLLNKKISIELRIVVSKLNVSYLSEISEFIIQHFPDATIVNFIGLETLGNCAKYLDQVYIDYTESFKYIKPAVKRLIDAGINTSLYNYPLCTVERGYWPLCKQSITPYKIRYADECTSCEAKNFCGGYFGSTLRVVKPHVMPVKF